MRRRLTPEEVALIARRAAELDAAPGHTAELDLAAAEEVLREVGVSDAAARRALQEWRAGQLEPPVSPTAATVTATTAEEPSRGLAASVSVRREVALAPDLVADRFDRLARRQCFTRGPRHGLGGDWVPRTGLVADLRRRLDVRGTLVLPDVGRLRLRVRPAPDGGSDVTLTADLSAYRSRLLGGLVGVPGGASVVCALAALGDHAVLLGTPIGLAAAGGGYVGATMLLRRRRLDVADGLHVLLDRL